MLEKESYVVGQSDQGIFGSQYDANLESEKLGLSRGAVTITTPQYKPSTILRYIRGHFISHS